MTVELLLNELRWEGVTLSLNGEDLHYRSEVSPLPEHIKKKLSAQKIDIIEHLRQTRKSALSGLPRLSNLQQAYWLGEQNVFRYAVPAMVHLVYATPANFDLDRFHDAVFKVMQRHPPLHMRIDGDGRPSLMAAYSAPVEFVDAHTRDSSVYTVLDDISATLPSLANGPPFKLVVVRGKSATHVHALLRLIAFDAPGVGVFMDDLAAAYNDPGCTEHWHGPAPCYAKLAALDTAAKTNLRYKPIKDYWTERLRNLPSAPKLPLNVDMPRRVKFIRYHGVLGKARWNRFQATARKMGLSINAALAIVFARALQRWSENKSFTINTMFSKRYETNGAADGAIGNFSGTLLLSIDGKPGSFEAQAKSFQHNLYEAMDKSAFDGVSALRLLGSDGISADPSQPVMPVVYSTQIGNPTSDMSVHARLGWRITDSSMTTPQVWLDHQVYETEGKLSYNWDVVEGVYPDQMIEGAFAHYGNILATLSDHPDAWSDETSIDLPANLLKARNKANQTLRPITPAALHTGLWDHAHSHPNAPAILHQGQIFTFGQTAKLANRLALILIERGIKPGDRVIVHGRKTPQTVIALFGVLACNGVYVPTSNHTPLKRIVHIAQHSEATAILSDDENVRAEMSKAGLIVIDHMDVFKIMPDDSGIQPPPRVPDPAAVAYIIYTSGSTGQPKGVVITHRAAANTIIDVLDRFSITPNDRLLSISELTFDLSVFDIFATSLGRTCLILPQDKGLADPGAWLSAAREHGATVWNSVPAIMDLAVSYLCGAGGNQVLDLRRNEIPSELRLFMASGDWVPLTLPDRLKRLFPGSAFISLGGATEAGIWSNYFVVTDIPPQWRSIPYGFPLANQRFHILDEDLQPSPPLVPGYLYIAGDSLAEGYLNNPQQTADSFFHCPSVGERVYRTGDLGRYDIDGCIEFLGRRDFQVKINGHRIELGEIEKTMQAYPGIERAVALVHKDAKGDASIVAAVVWNGAPDNVGALQHLTNTLPSYMTPKQIVNPHALPLTGNGKVDRKQLNALIERSVTETPVATNGEIDTPIISEMERRVASAWETVLGLAPDSVTRDFFNLGGDSLKAVHLLNELNQAFGLQLVLEDLYRNNTIREQVQMLSAPTSGTGTNLVPMSNDGDMTLYMFHPVGGAVLCYRDLAQALKGKVSVIGVAANDSAPGETVQEMAAAYADQILANKLAGPVMLGGWSMGGVLALETARILERANFPIARVFTIDSWAPIVPNGTTIIPDSVFAMNFIADLAGIGRDGEIESAFKNIQAKETVSSILAHACENALLPEGMGGALLKERYALFCRNYQALLRHHVAMPMAPVSCITAHQQGRKMIGLTPLSDAVAQLAHGETLLNADHYSILAEPSLGLIAKLIKSHSP